MGNKLGFSRIFNRDGSAFSNNNLFSSFQLNQNILSLWLHPKFDWDTSDNSSNENLKKFLSWLAQTGFIHANQYTLLNIEDKLQGKLMNKTAENNEAEIELKVELGAVVRVELKMADPKKLEQLASELKKRGIKEHSLEMMKVHSISLIAENSKTFKP